MRDLQVNLRLSGEERSRLDALALYYRLSVSDVIRMLVKRDFDKIQMEASQAAEVGERTWRKV